MKPTCFFETDYIQQLRFLVILVFECKGFSFNTFVLFYLKYIDLHIIDLYVKINL